MVLLFGQVFSDGNLTQSRKKSMLTQIFMNYRRKIFSTKSLGIFLIYWHAFADYSQHILRVSSAMCRPSFFSLRRTHISRRMGQLFFGNPSMTFLSHWHPALPILFQRCKKILWKVSHLRSSWRYSHPRVLPWSSQEVKERVFDSPGLSSYQLFNGFTFPEGTHIRASSTWSI